MAGNRLTLGHALSVALLFLSLVVGAVLVVLLGRWGQSLLTGSERLREAASRRVEAAVRTRLDKAEGALQGFEAQVGSGAADPDRPASVEAALLAQVLSHPDIAEATFTRARKVDDASDELAPDGRWQVSAFRSGTGSDRVLTRYTHQQGGGFVVDVRARPPGVTDLGTTPFVRDRARGGDPTDHTTFAVTLAHQGFSPDPLWTDLHYAEADSSLPAAERRVVVTVMHVVERAQGDFGGVARVGLRADRLDEVARMKVDEANPADPHRIFLADAEGRLVTRLRSDQPFEEQGDDLRPQARMVPDEVRLALAHPAIRGVSAEHPRASGRMDVGGRTYLVSALYLEGAQDWRVGIVVPQDHYLGDLQRTRNTLLLASAALFVVLLAVGVVGLRSIQGSLDGIVGSAARMRDFDFAPAAAASPFRDVRDVLGDLEQAKTALRAMAKYVPVGLVRQLYRARREPMLGGELREVTVMFTDIQGFTSVSERLAPDALAEALGRYLEVMTGAIHAQAGVVDKFIGDGVMALWNAPERRADHSALACAAALECRQRISELFASSRWQGLTPFRTRFGLHADEVMVGHFGAPDRMNFTALGDGVNLASRLEALNKVYGTTILVSQPVRDAVGDAFRFRLVDVVAVQGKTKGVPVHELLAAAKDGTPDPPAVAVYERAYQAYRQRRFAEALALLAENHDDPPSAVLADRCRLFLEEPPAEDWGGTFVARDK